MRRRPWAAPRIERRAALVLSVVILTAAGVADAETGFAPLCLLIYLVPIGLAVWFNGRALGYALCVIAPAISIAVDRAPKAPYVRVGDFVGELGLYFTYAVLIDGMRRRLATEASLRREALSQLRHADRLTTIGKLAAGLAHELGTPLNVVSGKANLISSGRLAGDAARRSARVIEEQADRMTAIIRHLLDFARRGGTGRSPTNLRLLAEETSELLRPTARKAEVTIACEGVDVEASVNRSEMQQVLSNLVTNAVHAMPGGGVVTLTTAEDGAHAIIRVSDEGDGIPADVLPRIFDPFFTTKDVGQGTGLGLSVVHGIVDDHGGSIEVETRTGRGTTFSLRLPR
ncbi:MAG: GHKL domain-containing protein [Labilithrix sp.]|nr:GHKL domain-containing protein [Labilithrix sp.]